MTVRWYADVVEAIHQGEPIYRICPSCDETGWPPRHTCPSCGAPEMQDRRLSMSATVAAQTTIHVTTPKFADETPYTVILAEFEEGVRLTGQLRGDTGVTAGDPVSLGVDTRDDDWVVTFTPE